MKRKKNKVLAQTKQAREIARSRKQIRVPKKKKKGKRKGRNQKAEPKSKTQKRIKIAVRNKELRAEIHKAATSKRIVRKLVLNRREMVRGKEAARGKALKVKGKENRTTALLREQKG